MSEIRKQKTEAREKSKIPTLKLMGDRTECRTRGNLDVLANRNTYQQLLKRRPEN